MEGGRVWDSSVSETLQEHMWRLNIVRHHRIAVLNGEANRELEATAVAAAAALALREAAELGKLSPDDTEDDILWQDETIWLEGYRVPIVNACPLTPQLLPRFIPGLGFAWYVPCPALRAYAPPYIPPSQTPSRRVPSRPACSFEHPEHVSLLEMVLSKGVFLLNFPEIVINCHPENCYPVRNTLRSICHRTF